MFVVSTGGAIAFGLLSATSSTAGQLILLRGETHLDHRTIRLDLSGSRTYVLTENP
jgi:hypothetical protein